VWGNPMQKFILIDFIFVLFLVYISLEFSEATEQSLRFSICIKKSKEQVFAS